MMKELMRRMTFFTLSNEIIKMRTELRECRRELGDICNRMEIGCEYEEDEEDMRILESRIEELVGIIKVGDQVMWEKIFTV